MGRRNRRRRRKVKIGTVRAGSKKFSDGRVKRWRYVRVKGGWEGGSSITRPK